MYLTKDLNCHKNKVLLSSQYIPQYDDISGTDYYCKVGSTEIFSKYENLEANIVVK